MPCWTAVAISTKSKQQVLQVIMTLEPERVLLRSIFSSVSGSCVRTKSSLESTLAEKRLTFLNGLNHLTLSLVSRTAPSSMDIQAAHPDSQILCQLRSSAIPVAATNCQAHMKQSKSHSADVNCLLSIEESSAQPATPASDRLPMQLAETSSLLVEAAMVVSNPDVAFHSHGTEAVQLVCPPLAGLTPSTFAGTVSQPFDAEAVVPNPHSCEAAVLDRAEHDTHMALLDEVELDATDTAAAAIVPTGGSSPGRTTLHFDAFVVDASVQNLQEASAVANSVQCTPMGATGPPRHSLPAAWNSEAPTDAGCTAGTSNVVPSLIASGMELFTPPPLLLGPLQSTSDASQVQNPLQQITLPPDSSNLQHPTAPPSGTEYQMPPHNPGQPTSLEIAATAASDMCVVSATAQLNGSPLLSTRTPRATPRFTVRVLPHRKHAEASDGKHLETTTVQHGCAPHMASNFASVEPTSCHTHAVNAAASACQPASALPTTAPPSFAQDGFEGGGSQMQQSTHVVRSTHDMSVATGALHATIPMNEALTNAILKSSDDSMLGASIGSLKAKTPSYRRPGYAYLLCGSHPFPSTPGTCR